MLISAKIGYQKLIVHRPLTLISWIEIQFTIKVAESAEHCINTLFYKGNQNCWIYTQTYGKLRINAKFCAAGLMLDFVQFVFVFVFE